MPLGNVWHDDAQFMISLTLHSPAGGSATLEKLSDSIQYWHTIAHARSVTHGQ